MQTSGDSTFAKYETLYQGPDFATFLSGLPNGHYYYRVRTIAEDTQTPGAWSATVTATVKHHSLAFALSLFGIGAIVFALTVGIVKQGNRRMVNTN